MALFVAAGGGGGGGASIEDMAAPVEKGSAAPHPKTFDGQEGKAAVVGRCVILIRNFGRYQPMIILAVIIF